jgi:hypothetical protein
MMYVEPYSLVAFHNPRAGLVADAALEGSEDFDGAIQLQASVTFDKSRRFLLY